ncbi:MAG TPA: hypothetical protein PLL10_00250 [Elusimicrobiales bacterium]|nr:hypothetical protein [Elusimicrobiales bacterium]
MSTLPFVPKDDYELPDSYGIKVSYVSGGSEEFELASHAFNKDTGLLEFWTKEDKCCWIPLSSVKRLEFDKRFSKIMEIKAKAKSE